MPGFQSALYTGSVVHRRLRPKPHRLCYRVFYLLLDLDEIDALAGTLRLFSHNRWNLFAFHDRDHGAATTSALRGGIERHLREAGIEWGGPIRLLTMPRVLGYVFNPLSIYFCHGRDGALSAILYEVSNTFGERHSYLIAVSPQTDLPIRQESRKSLYVSPFMTTDMTYSFSIVPPGEDFAVSVAGRDGAGPLIAARLALTRRDLSDASLAGVFWRFPLLTLKVIAGIHWEALLLWLKGTAVQHRPPPPDRPVTLGRNVARVAPTSEDEIHVVP